MRGFNRIQFSSLVAVSALFGGSQALWGSLIYERDLSNATGTYVNGINLPEPNNRSNVDWGSGPDSTSGYDIVGDSFSFAGGASIGSITVYEVANTTCANNAACQTPPAGSAPTSEFSSINLFTSLYSGGSDLTTLNEVPSSNLVGGTYSSVQTFYPTGVSYEGSTGLYHPIYALTFTFINPLIATAGVQEAFAVDGIASSTSNSGTNTLFLAAVNAPLAVASGAIENGADGEYIYYNMANQTATSTINPAGFPFFCDSGNAAECGGWDKSSDINVQINGTLLPEPGTVVLSLLGILAMASRLRRRV